MGGVFGKSEPIMVSEDVKIFVDTILTTKKVVIFSKTYCPYARKAKSVMDGYPIDPARKEVIEIEKRPDCAEIQAYMKELTGASSVPRVFIEGNCIGGGDETAALHESGELRRILEKAGVI